jgi:hypothetical protein
MRIAVYLKAQNSLTELASHEASRTLASRVLLICARAVRQGAIQLTTDESWQEVKARVKPQPVSSSIGPVYSSSYDSLADSGVLRPFDYDLIPWNYPIRDQRTVSVGL